MSSFIYNFTPKSYQFVFPPVYTEELTLSSIPAGFSAQTSGTGTPPSYGAGGMTTVPNAAGTSFIKKSAAGLDFDAGVLIDVVVQVPPVSAAPIKRAKVLRLSKGEHGVASVYVDFTTKEVWVDDIVNIPQTDFRPGVKGDVIFFRLSVKGTGSSMVARLYSSKEDFVDPPLLKQTGGPSVLIPSSIDTIDIGSIESGDAEVLVKSVKILLDEDPDTYYPFPQISSISPTSDVMGGGQTFKVEFDTEIDIDAGSSLLYVDDEFNDESTGAGSSTINFGALNLILAGVGKSMVRALRSYSGDLPSGADISSTIQVDQTILSNPPQSEVILVGVEMRSNGNTIAIELITSVLSGSYFRVRATSGGLLTLNKKVADTRKNNFVLRFVKAANQIRAIVDGVTLISTSLKDGPGIMRYYAETTENVSFTTEITNIALRPVVMVGDYIVNV